MERLETALISIASGTQMRAAIDVDTVNDYATKLNELPPITVFYDGSRYYCADGFHRLDAHRASGRTDIACDVKAGTLRDAILYAAGANATHGKRRTNADKRRAIETLLRDEEWRAKSDRWIAQVVKVSDPTVGKVREELYPVVQLQKLAVEHPPEPRRVQSQDGKTRTVPQRVPKPDPAPEPVRVVVTEEPIAAPRTQPAAPAKPRVDPRVNRAHQIAAELADWCDDLAAEGSDAAGSFELALLHLRQGIDQLEAEVAG
jgi:hypothetical protein